MLGSLLLALVAAQAPERPNVLFILADDLGYMDIQPNHPASFYETPSLQGLADTGMRFTNAYAACPVCSPTRASILTGQYPARLGVTDYINPGGGNQPEKWNRSTLLLPAPYTDRLDHEAVTLAEALRGEGYATYFAGKWHLGPEGWWPEDHGFDVNRGGITRGGPYGGKKYFSPYGNPRLEDGPQGEHLPDRLARETVSFIEQHAGEPWFAMLSFYSVHTPLMAREDLLAKYKAKKKQLGLQNTWGSEGTRAVRMVQEHAVYAGMVEAMDQAIGTVLSGIDRLELTDRTIVVFFSDNGGLSTSEGHPTSNLPLRAGKGWLYEGGIREPLLVRAPGVTQAGSTSKAVVSSIDFLPTLWDLCGLDQQLQVDGQSFYASLQGEKSERGPIFWHYPHYGNQGGSPGAAVRDGAWKLIHWFESGESELYRLDVDPGEQYDLAEGENERVRRMLGTLEAWEAETGALRPRLNDKPSKDSELKKGIDGLAWLAGHWAMEKGGVLSEEAWFAPRGGSMLGLNRQSTSEATEMTEFLAIVERDGEVYYQASPSGQAPAEFKMTLLRATRVVFENPEHDFPNRIEYIRRGHQLRALVTGDANGKPLKLDFEWKLKP